MNEKISSLFDSEINNKEVDTLLAKKNKMAGCEVLDVRIPNDQRCH